MEKLFAVGKIVNTHGIRGEIKVVPQTDFPDVRFASGSKLMLVPPEALGEGAFPVTVKTARDHKTFLLVRLEEFDNINQVEKYKGGQLKVTEDQLLELEEGEYYYYEIVGCSVVTEDGEEIGVVKEVLTPGANDVWVVKRPKGPDLLLPVIDECVLAVDVEAKRVTVHLMEGLL
ncbi:ribosome maturation factor RimM [Xylanibacillus composti]|uniref:Ribosome maturation factor RimM n=1 Tax=Xylanibacillus composti TaxID=1572762 RepID=A0A8J4H338_9BACL|nr:ribosome maturation factor RimM [Xylanibacillus composti]MDT9724121.1 ribosome maturation factor RimM [Xylanibacillus composti]GIQ68671.1 ribosome maturation factor RimM [Xylanibacillus composti]